MVSTASQLARKVKDMISYQKHTKDSLAKRVFFNEPASPPHVTPRVGYAHQCPPELKWAEEQNMKDREEYFCKAAARQTLFCAVWIVALVALIAWLV